MKKNQKENAKWANFELYDLHTDKGLKFTDYLGMCTKVKVSPINCSPKASSQMENIQ